MKKTTLATTVALVMGSVGIASADIVNMTSATFTMYESGGSLVAPDGFVNTVTGSIGDDTWSVASASTFFGLLWTAHGGATFGPGTYNIDTIEGGTYTGITVGEGQVGGHIYVNYGATLGINVVNIWDVTINGDGTASYYSTDIDDDGIRGIGMLDGAFPGWSVNFDFVIPAAVPIPATLWLFGSGLLGLIGLAKRKKV